MPSKFGFETPEEREKRQSAAAEQRAKANALVDAALQEFVQRLDPIVNELAADYCDQIHVTPKVDLQQSARGFEWNVTAPANTQHQAYRQIMLLTVESINRYDIVDRGSEGPPRFELKARFGGDMQKEDTETFRREIQKVARVPVT